MTNKIPTPIEFGLPPKFQDWYPNQWEILQQMLQNKTRFFTGVISTGSGKSLLYMALAQLSGCRTAILTSTKGLQTQLMLDFSSLGLVDVRGKNAYLCPLETDNTPCSEGLCITGFQCPLRFNETCPYYSALAKATRSKLVVTNYYFWMYNHTYGEGIGNFDMLILDEAHNLPQTVADFLTITIQKDHPVTSCFLPSTLPRSLDSWQNWAKRIILDIDKEIDYLKQSSMTFGGRIPPFQRVNLASLLAFRTKILQIPELNNNWILEESDKVIQFAPKWTQSYCESVLFRGIKNVVLVSATVCAKTISLLGIPKKLNTIKEYPSTFPVENRRLWHIPTIKMNYLNTTEELKQWVSRIDQILDSRPDRKGIIHTVSYKRRDILLKYTRHMDRMISHSYKDVEQTVETFKNSSEPLVLVSPSISTGYDFPLDTCRFQIIGKIAYPDMSSKILKARLETDPDYAAYLAAQMLVQAVGRAVRSPDDWCENFILDDNIGQLLDRFKDFFPKWFRTAVRKSATIPKAREL